MTTRGMKEKEMLVIVELIDKVLKNKGDAKIITRVKDDVRNLLKNFPLYPEIDDEQ